MDDWQERDLMNLTSLIKDGSHGSHMDLDVGIPLLSAKDVRDGVLKIPENCRKISNLDYQAIHRSYEVKKYDILLTIVGSIGRCYLVDGTEPQFSFQRSVAVIRPEGIDPKYLFHYFRSEKFQNCLKELTNASAQGGVYLGALAGCQIKFPVCFEEQRKIATILSAIDKAIEQTEAIIAKQQRIKTGLMQDLLTRGIDEHGNIRSEATHAFKDSPLGRIPVEWAATPLSSVVDMQVGYAFKSAWFAEEGISLLRGENVGYGELNWSDRRCLPLELAAAYSDYLLATGNIVIGMDRTFTKQGVKISCLQDEDLPCLLVQRVGRFVPKKIPVSYMQVILQSPIYQAELMLHQKGMDIPHLSKDEILSPLIPMPSNPNELDRISDQFTRLNSLESINNNQLSKLRLQKAALMQDLLTGKVRVTPLLEAGA